MIQVVIPSWINPRGKKALEAFAYGLGEIKERYQIVSLEDATPSEDPMVCWGVFKNKLPDRVRIRTIQSAQKRIGGELVILERGFVRREDYYMVSWDDICGRGRYPSDLEISSDRWNALEVDLKPWRQGSQILVIGQVPWDTACQHINHQKWVNDTCKVLRAVYPKHKIVFRPHPLQPRVIQPSRDVDYIDVRRSLEEALSRSKLVVTFSSTVGVDATIAGVPVVACDRTSMVYGLCSNNLRSTRVRRPVRRGWAHRLAYKQWTLAEMAQGYPWLHLHQGLKG